MMMPMYDEAPSAPAASLQRSPEYDMRIDRHAGIRCDGVGLGAATNLFADTLRRQRDHGRLPALRVVLGA